MRSPKSIQPAEAQSASRDKTIDDPAKPELSPLQLTEDMRLDHGDVFIFKSEQDG